MLHREFRRKVEASLRSSGREDLDHLCRYVLIIDMISRIARPDMKVLDVASSGQVLPALRDVIGFQDIRVTNGGPGCESAVEELHLPPSKTGAVCSYPYDIFDIEKTFPYPNETFDLIIFTEVLEHITRDPMHTMSELNRITKVGGWLMLETPNSVSLRAVIKCVRGDHPQVWSQYLSDGSRDRHNREYTPEEVKQLINAAGYEVHEMMTANDSYVSTPSSVPKRIGKWGAAKMLSALSVLLGNYVSSAMRGEAIYVTAKKLRSVQDRFPEFLYSTQRVPSVRAPTAPVKAAAGRPLPELIESGSLR